MATHISRIQSPTTVCPTPSQKSSNEPAASFKDNRSEAVAQRKLQAMIDDSPQVQQVAQMQAMADDYVAEQQSPIRKKENNTRLPDSLKAGVENLSGYSMDDVNVHYNSPKPAQLQAHAYAQGTDIHLGPGQEKHLPHEAWHVVQQKQGRVKPTLQMKAGININDDAGLEKEADVMGRKALQMYSYSGIDLKQLKTFQDNKPVIQRFLDKMPKDLILEQMQSMNLREISQIRGTSKRLNRLGVIAQGRQMRSGRGINWFDIIHRYLTPAQAGSILQWVHQHQELLSNNGTFQEWNNHKKAGSRIRNIVNSLRNPYNRLHDRPNRQRFNRATVAANTYISGLITESGVRLRDRRFLEI